MPASGGNIGDVEFGDEALKFPSTNVAIDWYDYLFKGTQNEFAVEGGSAAGKPVHIFVMGPKRVPPGVRLASARKQTHSLFPSTRGGSANSLRGDGALSATPPKKKRPTNSLTISEILCPLLAARSAATPSTMNGPA